MKKAGNREIRDYGDFGYAPDLISITAKLPHGFVVAFKLTADRRMEVEWEPEAPYFRSDWAKRRFLAHYKRARRVFAEQCATVVGGGVLFMDVDTRLEGIRVLGIDTASPLAKH